MGVGRRRSCVVLLLVASAVAVATPAWAHGQVRPGRAAAGTTIDTVLVVPSERDGHGNSRIALAVPPGFTPVSCGSPIGWRCATAEKGFSWERVTGLVAAEDFDLRMQVADAPGTYVLPLSQTYDDNETRTFTGPPGARDEAPLFTVTGTTGVAPAPSASPTTTPRPAAAGASAAASASPASATGAAPTGAASPTPPAATAPEAAAASPRSDAGLGALPAGRRLPPSSSGGGPTALLALGFVALTVLMGAVLLVRRRQGGPRVAP